MNKNMHSSFFIALNFEIWVYKDMKIHFSLETLGLAQMTPFHYSQVSTKLPIMHSFRQFKYDKSGRKHGNQTNNPIFSIYFFRSNCLQDSFLNLKILKIHFMCFPLWSILVFKIPQFLATDSDSSSYFSREQTSCGY